MAKTLQQIEQQIAQLQQQAQTLRMKAAQGAVANIRKLMAEHGLSVEELTAMLAVPAKPQPATRAKKTPSAQAVQVTAKTRKAAKVTKPAKGPKSSGATASAPISQSAASGGDAAGTSATVPGQADAASQTSAASKATRKAKPGKPSAKPPAKKVTSKSGVQAASQVGVIMYRDDAGHAWTGRGTKPKWFVAALAAGKTAQDLMVKPAQA
jgi:DNA-binding protein H-NS